MILRELFSKISIDVRAAISGLNKFNAEMDGSSDKLDKTEKGAKEVGETLDDTGKKAGTFGEKLAASFKKGARSAFQARAKIKSSAKDMGEAMGATALAVTAAAVGVGALTVAWGENSLQLSNMSKMYQLSTDDIQAFSKAMSFVGLEVEDGLEAIREMRLRMGEARREGASPLKDALTDLGISFNAFQDLPMLDQMGVLADRLSEVTDESRQAALLDEIAGDDLAKILPLLTEGSVGMQALIDKTKELNLIQSKGSIAAGAKLAKSWKTVTAVLATARGLIAGKLEPTVSSIIDTISKWVTENRKLITGKLVGFLERLVNVASDFIPVAAEMADHLLKVIELLGGVDGAIIAVVASMAIWKASTSTLLGASGPWIAGLIAVTAALAIFSKKVEAADNKLTRMAAKRRQGLAFRRRGEFTTPELEAAGAPGAEVLRLESKQNELIRRSEALGVGDDVGEFRAKQLALLRQGQDIGGAGIGPSPMQAVNETIREFRNLEKEISNLDSSIQDQISLINDEKVRVSNVKARERALVSAESIKDEEKKRKRVRELTELLRRETIDKKGATELQGLIFALGLDPIEALDDFFEDDKKGKKGKDKKKEPTIEELVGLGPKGLKTISDLVPQGQGTTINNFSFDVNVESPVVNQSITPPMGTSPREVANEAMAMAGDVIAERSSSHQRELIAQMQG